MINQTVILSVCVSVRSYSVYMRVLQMCNISLVHMRDIHSASAGSYHN